MNYLEFKNKFSDMPFIDISVIKSLYQNGISLKSNINKWVRKGYLHRLKNNIYVFNENDRRKPINRLFIANNLYFPSYISLEYALFYYGLIPEAVYEITSITILKTKIFKNILGVFSYTNIKKELFWGIKSIKDENDYDILIATPEKAILDFIYFRYFKRPKLESLNDFLKKSRIQNLSKLNINILIKYSDKFNNKFKDEIKRFLLEKIK